MQREVTCPACGRRMPRAYIRPGDIRCPYCNELVEVDGRVGLPIAFVSLIFAFYIPGSMGLTGGEFLLCAAAIFIGSVLLGALLVRWFWVRLIKVNPAADFRITGPRNDKQRKQ